MSALRLQALGVAEAELGRRRGLHRLAPDELRAVEVLAATIALRVADALETAAESEPRLAQALEALADQPA